jgi:hypothetical protein
MRLRALSERPYGQSAQPLVDIARITRADAIQQDPKVLRGDFHAAAVLSGGDTDTGDTYIETTLWLGSAGKIPAIIRAISSMAACGDRDVLLAVAYGGEPGQDAAVHAPCEECMRKLVAFDSDHSCDIVVERRGSLMLLNLNEFLREIDHGGRAYGELLSELLA